jgi:two-component system chemotaxis response regulator CheB
MATPKTIRVLVVDDSAVIREILCEHIGATPGMEVAGTATNGRSALESFDLLRPDVVTLDIQMPVMDGLATLDALLQRRPVPVIMCSSLSRRGADITFEALDRGALDYVAKPDDSSQAGSFGEELVRKIRAAAGADVQRILEIRRNRQAKAAQRPAAPAVVKTTAAETSGQYADACIAIGISTGGPPALAGLFEALQPPMPPIVVVQHMPANFTKPLAWRLDSISALSIKEAEHGDVLRQNQVFIAPGGKHLQIRRYGSSARVAIVDAPPVSGHKPSVDVMMQSAAEVFGRRLLGVIMTGMGRDGAGGCAAIRAVGGCVLGQDEATSDVYGMNKVAWVAGHVDRQFALPDAARIIASQGRCLSSPAAMAAGSCS